MSQIAVALFPPLYWQDFERLTLTFVQRIWDADNTALNGRAGQPQAGVDVYGTDVKGKWFGIQCKRRKLLDKTTGERYSERGLGPVTLSNEVAKAEDFEPKLTRYFVATTRARDDGLQSAARTLTTQRKQIGKFSVELLFWEDFEEALNRDSDLMKWYYKDILEPAGQINPDRNILDLIRTAFSRAAFTTPMHIENGGNEFLQAIVDTQQAINTGILVNRRGEIVQRAPKADRLSRAEWKDSISRAGRLLQQARDEYTLARQKRLIVEEGCLLVNPEVAEKLNLLRRDALLILNQVLASANMQPVQSPLLEPWWW